MYDTYAPVASWSSICMLTTIALQQGWIIRQIDFSNAFVHAPMNRTVCVSLPAMFNDIKGIPAKELCLHLQKSLYGLRKAPKLWHDFLEKGLLKAGFRPSCFDPGIYFGRGMALVVYVDDVLLFGPDEKEMQKVLEDLKLDGFELKLEKDGAQQSYDFLGINVTETKEGDKRVVKFTQLGLISKFLECVKMTECSSNAVPCSISPLGTNPKGKPHCEDWDYASAVGMLMYLAGNAYPEIQYAVHQCARFTHAPKTTHTTAVKTIACYLKGVLEQKQGLHYTITNNIQLDLFCDADYAGLWKYEDDQDPVCVRSRTGYVVTLGGCPIHWTSKLQTEVALSTLEAEYIALAMGMQELIPLRCFYEDLTQHFGIFDHSSSSILSKVWEDNQGCIQTATAPKISLRTKHIAVKYHFVQQFLIRTQQLFMNILLY